MKRFSPLLRIFLTCLAAYLVFVIGCALFQRKLLYMPSHHQGNNGLAEWHQEGHLIGYARHVPTPGAVWLFLHGNAGQATDRTYALQSFSSHDSVYFLEYPGYGLRAGAPSLTSLNAAALEAYELLRLKFSDRPVCVAAESLGCGPAAFLATNPHPPDKIVLILPFDSLAAVAADHFPFLPVKMLLHDNWDTVSLLSSYQGQLEIFAAQGDTVIPIIHARTLAASKPSAVFHLIGGDHNDWPDGNKVTIRYVPEKQP